MILSVWSLLAVAVVLAALILAWSGRFLAVGVLILANIVVHILGAVGGTVLVCGDDVCGATDTFTNITGAPNVIQWELGLHGDHLAEAQPIAAVEMVTHMFVHADFFHLFGNLIILLAFALPFEERIGSRSFVTIYLIGGFAGAIAQAGSHWGDPILMIGASGAVFAIIGAFAGAYPNLVVPLPLPLLYIMIWVRMRVIVAAIIFGTLQIVSQFLSKANPGDNTAYFAHLGGLVAGILLGTLYVRRSGRERAAVTDASLDLDALERFAVDDDGRRALSMMRQNVDEPTVFEAWLERYLLAARSPETGARLALRKGRLVSSRGEQFDVRKGRI